MATLMGVRGHQKYDRSSSGDYEYPVYKAKWNFMEIQPLVFDVFPQQALKNKW